MKRITLVCGLLFVLSVLVFNNLGIVSAVNTCTNPDDTIFRISADTNAHGEVYNGVGNYGEEICALDFFESSFPTSGLRTCTGANSIVQLSDDTNAHFEVISQTNYDSSGKEICYGDLECVVALGVCPTGKVSILSLDSLTNAHGARGIGYSQVICCSSPTVNSICNFNNNCEDERGENVNNCQDCQVNPCGNGILNPGEQCDPARNPEFDPGLSCVEFDANTGGVLSCDSNSCLLNLDSCIGGTSGVCGDGVINGNEQCEGRNYGGISCQDFGFTGGVLGCFSQGNANQCLIDTSLCTTTVSVGADFAKWTDFSGNEITTSSNGRTVRMLTDTSLIDGTEVIFEVFDKDSFPNPDDKIRTIAQGSEFRKNVNASGGAFVSWHITQADIDAGGNEITSPELEYYFTVSDSTDLILTSGILSVDPEPGANTNPIAQIIDPEQGEVYLVGAEIEFEGLCIDAEGPVFYNWAIESQGNEITLPESIGDDADLFTYVFNDAGQKTISLECIDEQGASDLERVSILILDLNQDGQINAFIDKPRQDSFVQSDIRKVDFSALNSYVLESSFDINTCTAEINCLGGDCPLDVSGVSPDWESSCSPIIPITNTNNKRGSFSDIEFTWTFSGGYSYGPQLGLVQDDIIFGADGRKTIETLLKYQLNGLDLEGRDEVEFRLVGPDFCYRGDDPATSVATQIIDLDEQGNEIGRYDVGSGAGEVACNYLGSSCCPAGASCNINNGACEISEKDSCSDYETQSACEGDDDEEGLNLYLIDPLAEGLDCVSGNPDPITGETLTCECAWKVSSDECVFKTNYNRPQDPGEDHTLCIEPQSPSCLWDTPSEQEYDCAEGDTIKRINLEGEFDFDYTLLDSGNVCSDFADFIDEKETECLAGKTIEIDCTRRGVKLPFFGFWQLILSGSAIAMIYYLFLDKKGKKKE
jgi:hypothetical protein